MRDIEKIKDEHAWIWQSNLIENVDDRKEDARSLRAWKWLLKQPWSMKTVLGLHGRIMRRLMGKEAGNLRTCDVGIYQAGGLLRRCPHWEKVPALLRDWVENCPMDWKEAHVAFEKIHPFRDGNGRTGRMLMNWQRVTLGMEPLLILAMDRHDYYRWFE